MALTRKKPIVITPGEPAGIGPDIFLKWAQYPVSIPVLVIADKYLLEERAAQLKLPLPSSLSVYHIPLKQPCRVGYPDPANAAYILETLQVAAEGCLNGDYAAMVTGPVNKAVLNKAGIAFSGNTEWLAELLEVPKTVMLFVSDAFKVALYTTHIPLTEVPSHIQPEPLKQCLTLLQQGFKHYFQISRPRIAVCGLNPHAGEGGYIGKEEITIITPTLEALRKEGFLLSGPLPADTAFTPAVIEQHDVILALYHDQGLPVIKAQSFNQAVNVTLGLPIIRTSVDHGTAFDLAGTGLADEKSLATAISLATQIAEVVAARG